MTFRRVLKATTLAVALAAASCSGVRAADLGIEGAIYEPIEEDMRVVMMRLVAAHDWAEQQDELKTSAENYTKDLPAYYLPRADKTQTRWKDVGMVTTEDIYLPTVDWQTGSVFDPQKALVAPAGTYLNPIAKLPSRAIERLFVFDATDQDQLEYARALAARNIPQLSFMSVAGDVGELSKEMDRPVFHPDSLMLQKFHITALPTLIGFGKGPHQGHMALTEFALPGSLDDVQKAWFGLPYAGYQPDSLDDAAGPVEPAGAQPAATNIANVTPAVVGPDSTNQQQANEALLALQEKRQQQAAAAAANDASSGATSDPVLDSMQAIVPRQSAVAPPAPAYTAGQQN